MLFKFLVFVAVIYFVYRFFFKKSREGNLKNKNKDDEITDTMVECPTCGTYVSKDEAILSNGKYFCSRECLK